MAKASAKTTSKTQAKPKRWFEQLVSEAVDEALDEATVDCNDEEDQHSGLLCTIDEELMFPFPAMVLGEQVMVIGMEWPEDDGFGLDLVCERNGKPHRIEARSVELVEPLPKGHLSLAAYMVWRRRM